MTDREWFKRKADRERLNEAGEDYSPAFRFVTDRGDEDDDIRTLACHKLA